MKTIQEIITDIKNGKSSVSIPDSALEALADPRVPHWLIEKILNDSLVKDYTVKEIKSLIKNNRMPIKEFREKLAQTPLKAGLCTQAGCGRKHFKQGYCKPHYTQIIKDGFTHPIWVNNHRKLAEKVLGKPLPPGVIVHHIDADPTNNQPSNLVICPDQAYHLLIERRGRAYKASQHAHWIKCKFCKKYDDPNKLHIPKSRKNKNLLRETWAYHMKCWINYEKERKKNFKK